MIKLIIVAVIVTVVAHAQTQQENRPYGQDVVTPLSLPEKTLQPCTAQYATCLKPLMTAGGNVSLGGPETWTAAELKNRCQMFSAARSCIQQGIMACPASIQVQSNIFSQMMDYICNDVFDEIVQLSGCLSSPKAQKDLQQCIQDVTQAQAGLLHSDSGVDEVQAQCSILSEYEECVIDVEGQDCGERAQELYIQIFTKINELVSEEINCTAEDPEPESDILYPKEAEVCVAATSSCLEDLGTYRTSMTEFDVNELPQICRAFDVAKRCMDTEASQCETAQEWQILEQSFAAMCDPDTLPVLLRPNPCLNSTLLTSKLDNCVSRELQSDSDMEEEQTCQILEEYLSCYAQAVEQTCPEEISAAVENVLQGVSGIIELEKSVDCQPEVSDPEENEDDPEITEKMTEECAMAIASCLKPLEPHRKGFTSFQLETIPQVCSDFGKVEDCMEKTMKACETTPEWEIIENAFSQICTVEGVTECPVRSDVVTKLKSCERDELKAEVTMDDDRTCQVLQEYVNCYSITVDRECEEKDGQLVSQVMTGVAQVIQLDKEVICEDNSGDSEEDGDSDQNDSEPTEEPTATDDEDGRVEDTWGPLAPCVGRMADMQVNPIPINRFESLDELCKHASESKACANKLLPKVPEEALENWKQLMTAINFVCQEKREEFSQVYSCIVDNMDSSPCYDEVPMPEAEEDDVTPICRMVNDFEQCAATVAAETCGNTAGNLMWELSSKMNDILAKDYHVSCPFQTGMSSYHKMVIGVSVGVASLVVLIVIAVVVAACRRRSRNSNSLDKKELVKNDILQQNIKIGLDGSHKDSGVTTLSVSKLDI